MGSDWIVTVIVRSIGLALFGIVATGCCQREIMSQYPSPSGNNMLLLIRRNCGAFDSFETEVRLRHSGSKRDIGELMASINSVPIVQVTWQDDSSVLIFVPPRVNVSRVKADHDGVRFEVRQ
jgi:hypothetical protein